MIKDLEFNLDEDHYLSDHIIKLQKVEMDGLFDDDIDIFICDLQESDKGKQYLVSDPQLPHQNIKTHPSRKESISNQSYISNINQSKCKNDSKKPQIKLQDKNADHDLSKKQRNRVAAKQSRDRRKLYIQLMENQHKKLDRELIELDDQLVEVKKKISKFVSENKILTGFNTLSQLEGKLDKLLRMKPGPDVDVEINIMLDSMRYRLGATGKERVMKVNEFFKQIIHLSLPPVLRHLVWDATQKRHLFKDNPEGQHDEFYEEFLRYLPGIQKYQPLFSKLGPAITEKKLELIKLLQTLNEIKLFLKDKCNQIQNEADDVRQILTPRQCLSLLMLINKKRFNPELNYLNTTQNGQIKVEQEPQIMEMSFPHKRAKENPNQYENENEDEDDYDFFN